MKRQILTYSSILILNICLIAAILLLTGLGQNDFVSYYCSESLTVITALLFSGIVFSFFKSHKKTSQGVILVLIILFLAISSTSIRLISNISDKEFHALEKYFNFVLFEKAVFYLSLILFPIYVIVAAVIREKKTLNIVNDGM